MNVTPVNDAPSVAVTTTVLPLKEDINYVPLAVADFTVSYSDPDADPFAGDPHYLLLSQ